MEEENVAALDAAGDQTPVETAEQPQAQDAAPDGGAEDQQQNDADELSASQKKRARQKEYRETLRRERDEAVLARQQAEERLAHFESLKGKTPEPQEGDYADYAKFVADRAAWAASQTVTQMNADHIKQSVAAANSRVAELDQHDAQVLRQNWSEQVQAATSRYTDFADVVGQPDLFPKGAAIVPLIQASDMAADLAYAIAQDRPLHDRLVRMPPLDAAREIGRMEARLQIPKSRKLTQAPAPISPIKGGAVGVPDADTMSMDDFVAARMSGKIR